MKSAAQEKHNYKSLGQRNNAAFLYIGTFFLMTGGVSVVILMSMFFLNTLDDFFTTF